MKRILVIQTAFLGDVVLSTALLEKLHSRFPDADIEILVRQGNESLFSRHPFLHEVHVWNKKSSKLSGLIGIIQTIRQRKYDIVINLQRFASSGLITLLSGAKRTYGFDKNPFSFFYTERTPHIIGDGRHEVDRNQQVIASLTDETSSPPRLYPSPTDLCAIQPYVSKPYRCIAPGSVWFTKTWPEHKWAEWIKLLQDRHANDMIYLLGAPNESQLCERIRIAAGAEQVINLAGKLSLLQSAALMAGARMNYVNDSGPMHLASAMNAPVAAIFCSTVPAFGFGPLSDRRFIIESSETLDCRPCGLHGFLRCPKGHFRCAESIDPHTLPE